MTHELDHVLDVRFRVLLGVLLECCVLPWADLPVLQGTVHELHIYTQSRKMAPKRQPRLPRDPDATERDLSIILNELYALGRAAGMGAVLARIRMYEDKIYRHGDMFGVLPVHQPRVVTHAQWQEVLARFRRGDRAF